MTARPPLSARAPSQPTATRPDGPATPTIATLTTAGQATQVDLYQIGGRHEPFGAVQNGAQLVGGNSADGLRVRDGDGRVWRHNSSGGWQATSIVVSFLATQL